MNKIQLYDRGDGIIMQIVSENDTICTTKNLRGEITENVLRSELSPVEVIFPDVNNPYVISDYPYGFTLRCQMRVYIEYREKFGFRVFSVTSNPKKDNLYWNKPKAGVYHKFAAVIISANKHYHVVGLGNYCSQEELIIWRDLIVPYYPDIHPYDFIRDALNKYLTQ